MVVGGIDMNLVSFLQMKMTLRISLTKKERIIDYNFVTFIIIPSMSIGIMDKKVTR